MGLLNLVPEYAKSGVRDGKMEIFDDLHVVGRNHYADIAQSLHLSSVETRDTSRDRSGLARETESGQYVGRVPAGADGESNIAGREQILKLLGEDAVVPRIVRPSRDQSHVLGKRDGAQPLACRRRGAFAEVAGHVRGQSRAPSVAKEKDGAAAVVGLKEGADQIVNGCERKLLNDSGELFQI